jgi:hypothetical protein
MENEFSPEPTPQRRTEAKPMRDVEAVPNHQMPPFQTGMSRTSKDFKGAGICCLRNGPNTASIKIISLLQRHPTRRRKTRSSRIT